MGLFQAAIGAIGGTLADQWVDFFGVPDGIGSTAAIFPAVRKGENAGRGGNDRLCGGKGRDRLRAGKGRDRCKGGPARDVGRGCERGSI